MCGAPRHCGISRCKRLLLPDRDPLQNPDVGDFLLTVSGESLRVVGVLVNLEDEDGMIDGFDLTTIQTDRDLIDAMRPFYHPLLPEDVVCVYDGLVWTLTLIGDSIECGGSFNDAVDLAWAKLSCSY
jgi:hypothetical protein